VTDFQNREPVKKLVGKSIILEPKNTRSVEIYTLLCYSLLPIRRNQINSRYLMGLGLLGLGETENAKRQLNLVLEMDFNHQGGRQHINSILAP